MNTISIAVSNPDYEGFRTYAKVSDRSIAELIREAMAFYREKKMSNVGKLEHLTVIPHRFKGGLPTRVEIYDEMADRHFPPR